jgi:peptide/nickel transport system substrate-binding protein
VRPAFNVLYVGVKQKNNPKLQDLRVRQAVAHAINREQLVTAQLPEGAKVASQFIPDTVVGYNDEVQPYPFDTERARSLLAEAGATGLAVNFYWPSEVTRPYMPNPRDMFGAISADLQKAGFQVNPITKPWNGGYLDDVDNARADLFLLGWTGDYNTPDNFIGSFFGTSTNRFWTQPTFGDQLVSEIQAADGEPDADKRKQMYRDLNRKLVEEYLPAIPISHSPPAIVTSSKVQGLVPSPLTQEEFGPCSLT